MFILYGSELSPYTRAVHITFTEKGINYSLESIGPDDLAAPDYDLKHPFRKLPALAVDGHCVFETSAIMRYIDEVNDDGVALQPDDPLKRAYCEQWLSAANSYLYGDVFTGLIFQRSYAANFGMPVNEELIASSASKTQTHLGIIAEALKTGSLGSGITLADILVGSILLPLKRIEEGRSLLNDVPRVSDYLAALSSRPSFADPAS